MANGIDPLSIESNLCWVLVNLHCFIFIHCVCFQVQESDSGRELKKRIIFLNGVTKNNNNLFVQILGSLIQMVCIKQKNWPIILICVQHGQCFCLQLDLYGLKFSLYGFKLNFMIAFVRLIFIFCILRQKNLTHIHCRLETSDL